jgi:nucleoside 2-deoxyribosyltransferase
MKNNKLKIFLSGGFKSNWQNNIVEKYNDDFIFFNPREHGLDNPEQYTTWDVHFVKECDILFAYMEETNPSGYGLAFELGLAYGLGKTIILIDEKSKKDDLFSRYFKILHNSSNVVFDNFEDGIKFLDTFKQ